MVEIKVSGASEQTRAVLSRRADAGGEVGLGRHPAGGAAAGLSAVFGDDELDWREVEDLAALRGGDFRCVERGAAACASLGVVGNEVVGARRPLEG